MLGDELRKAREDADLTQEQLAFRAEIDRTYVSQLENNKKSPTVDVLLRICAAIGVSAADLISRIDIIPVCVGRPARAERLAYHFIERHHIDIAGDDPRCGRIRRPTRESARGSA
jgi:transcriptional regulator with XRE-family HTH domain